MDKLIITFIIIFSSCTPHQSGESMDGTYDLVWESTPQEYACEGAKLSILVIGNLDNNSASDGFGSMAHVNGGPHGGSSVSPVPVYAVRLSLDTLSLASPASGFQPWTMTLAGDTLVSSAVECRNGPTLVSTSYLVAYKR